MGSDGDYDASRGPGAPSANSERSEMGKVLCNIKHRDLLQDIINAVVVAFQDITFYFAAGVNVGILHAT
jgi:hypothetical protein